MKRKIITSTLTGVTKIILSSLIIITLCLLNILFCSIDNSSALTYSSNAEVGFTFNPTISVNLSGDLLINNLSPGSVSDSNVINVNVATNASQGYVLTATSGTKTTNTDLVNQTNSAYKFSSIATNASLSNLTTDNTWGYSYSEDSGTNWSNYSGLPLDNDDEGATGKQLISTINPADNRTLQFKIAARASSNQAAGTYQNTINFYAVANPDPMTIYDLDKLQDFASLSEEDLNSVRSTMTLEKQYVLQDIRDNKTYSIAKLADDNIWMTQNLDLNLDSTKTYTSADTDLPNGTTWRPSTSTYSENANLDWNSLGDYIPVSQDSGEKYWNLRYDWTTYHNSCENDWDINCDESIRPGFNNHGDSRYMIGNHYNGTAAIAMNDSHGIIPDGDYGLVDQSICPAGWTLPRTGSGDDSFYSLLRHYGFSNSTFYGDSGVWDYPTYFVPTDEEKASNAYYYSSVFDGNGGAYLMYINYGNTVTKGHSLRRIKGFVRCVARPVTTQIEGIYEGGVS